MTIAGTAMRASVGMLTAIILRNGSSPLANHDRGPEAHRTAVHMIHRRRNGTSSSRRARLKMPSASALSNSPRRDMSQR